MRFLKTVSLALLGVVAVAGVAGGTAWWVVQRGGVVAAAERPPALPEAANLVVVTMPHFLTDLADRDRPRFVDVTVALGVKDEKAKAKVQALLPAVRDAVLGHLRSLRAEDLAGATGKDRLASDLVGKLGTVTGGLVQRVFITDLVVQ